MGFDVNFNNKPVIQGAQSAQDGGAGNLGYFERGGEKDEHNELSKNTSIFDGDSADSFKKSSDEEEDSEPFSIANLIARIILAIKDLLRKIFKLNS